jgi:hypothetical protein
MVISDVVLVEVQVAVVVLTRTLRAAVGQRMLACSTVVL